MEKWILIWLTFGIVGAFIGFLVGLHKRPDIRDTHERID